jgi:hypothetical protein
MSFEDDEYWDDEYSEYSLVPNAAVIQEKKYERRSAPDPVIPTRRRDGDDDETPVDELAARRKRRAAGSDPFGAQRPSWLDDPDRHLAAQPGRGCVRRRRLQPARAGR